MTTVRVDRAGAVTTVILDRPEVRNAVDRATALALADAFRAFEADDSASVAVLWGAGGTFCAGADLTAFAAGDGNRVAPDGDGPMGPTRMTLSKPVIAAVAGHAVAGGLELACWCDLRVVEEDAVFGVFCRRWGVPLIDGGTVRLPRLVGMSRALDMILTGRAVGAAEAYAMGLANRVVAPGAVARRGARAGGRDRAIPAGDDAQRPGVGLRTGRPVPRRGARSRIRLGSGEPWRCRRRRSSGSPPGAAGTGVSTRYSGSQPATESVRRRGWVRNRSAAGRSRWVAA